MIRTLLTAPQVFARPCQNQSCAQAAISGFCENCGSLIRRLAPGTLWFRSSSHGCWTSLHTISGNPVLCLLSSPLPRWWFRLMAFSTDSDAIHPCLSLVMSTSQEQTDFAGPRLYAERYTRHLSIRLVLECVLFGMMLWFKCSHLEESRSKYVLQAQQSSLRAPFRISCFPEGNRTKSCQENAIIYVYFHA